MKSAFLASTLICVIVGTLVVSKQKGNAVRPLPLPCESMEYKRVMMDVKGYHIITCKSLKELQEEVRKGLKSTEDWRPFGGVTYVPGKLQYLQVMVHPTNQPPAYP